MKDYDIKIEGATKITVYGTNDDTVLFPASAKIDTDRNKFDVDVEGVAEVRIGIPCACEKLEIACGNATLTVRDLTFEDLEIDGKGDLKIAVSNIRGAVQINLLKGTAALTVPEDYSFRTFNKGRGCRIDNSIAEDPSSENSIELNGKDSVLTIAK